MNILATITVITCILVFGALFIIEIYREGKRAERERMRSKASLQPPGVNTIKEQQLPELFLNAPNHPLWRATLAAVDLEVQDALEAAIDEGLTNEQLRFRVGGVSGLLQFKQTLLNYEQQARQIEHEQNAAKKTA